MVSSSNLYIQNQISLFYGISPFSRLNHIAFSFRSLEGRDPATELGYKQIERVFGIYPSLNTTNTTERINMTLCTLYRSCSQITEYDHSNITCDECTVTYNHCPWIPIMKQSSGVNDFTANKEFQVFTLFIWFILQVIVQLFLFE